MLKSIQLKLFWKPAVNIPNAIQIASKLSLGIGNIWELCLNDDQLFKEKHNMVVANNINPWDIFPRLYMNPNSRTTKKKYIIPESFLYLFSPIKIRVIINYICIDSTISWSGNPEKKTARESLGGLYRPSGIPPIQRWFGMKKNIIININNFLKLSRLSSSK